ncbi:MAG: DUF3048 domain-containing protein [Lachnospiraceae bacterium]|nr:DUF3048 domain-containing protein [Lachnospiraceae bacterium]
MRKGFLWGVLLCLSAGVLSGCSGKYEEAVVNTAEVSTEAVLETTEISIVQETTEAETEAETEPEKMAGLLDLSDRTPVDGKVRSYLTGEWVDAAAGNRRPVATMMSNDKGALPQYGINRAGVIYEAPVEGAMNRYMSIIEDYDNLERIGSTRSCRTYYTYFAREFDAVYSHFGQSTFALPYLKNVDNINGIEGIGAVAFYRSKDKSAPHNAYTSGERLKKAIEKLGYRTEYAPDYRGHYQFADGEYVLGELPGVMAAKKVAPGYAMNKPSFVYEEEDGLYHRYQYGDLHRGSEGPIAVKNLIIQYCQTGHYATTEYLNINVHTSGENGYYFTNGQGIPITWDKDGEFGVTHYYGPDGKEIILNQGRTWVCIVNALDENKLEIYGE